MENTDTAVFYKYKLMSSLHSIHNFIIFCSRHCSTRDFADSMHPPRQPVDVTGSLMGGYRVGIPLKTNFGRSTARSHAGLG
jgi:hypothetical protein